MKILNNCKDYKILEKELDAETLNKIDKVLIHYEDYITKNDDGVKDIIGEYYGIYGNGYVIDWYEGLMSTEEFLQELKEGYQIADEVSIIKEELNNLVRKQWLWSYELKDNELTIRYGLSSVRDTERAIDLENKTLKQALFESGEDIRIDIESSLVDENDFFGYDNEEQLEDRIIEETDFLKQLSELVGEI